MKRVVILPKEGEENEERRIQNRAWARTLATSTDQDEKNKAATGLFHSFYKPVIHWFLTNIGTTSETRDVGDLVQKTMEKMLGNIHKYKATNAELSTWVYKIALNTLLDHKRKGRFIDVISVDAINHHNSSTYGEQESEVFELPSGESTPDAMAGTRQAHDIVRAAVAALKNQKERRAIELRFFEERTYEEIAEEMEVPMGTVKVLLFRAKESLRALLPNEAMVTA